MPRLTVMGLLALALTDWDGCSQSLKSTREVFITPDRSASRAGLTSGATTPGLDWLAGQQGADGSFGNTAASLARPVQCTAEVLRTWQLSGASLPQGFPPALAYLSNSAEQGTEVLAWKIIVNARQAGDVTPWVNTLLTHQQPDGGFGPRAGHDSNALDSAFALEALAAANYQSGSKISAAVAFLMAKQQGNGGWSIGSNDTSVYVTAGSMRALWPYHGAYAGVGAGLTQAQNFLLSRRAADGLWGEDFLSALALIAVIPVVPDVSVVSDSASALQAHQKANGSWGDDSYTTALVLQALQAYEARKNGTTPSSGSLTGFVVRANSTEPIAGVTITIAQVPGVAVLTNGDGYYVIPGLSAGSYTVSASRSGYAAASVVASVQAGQVTVADRLVLDVLDQYGIVRGKVFDAVTRQPLAGVQVTLTGPASGPGVLTVSTGDFYLGPVAPGSYGLKFEKAGYVAINGTATVVAGQVLTAQLGLMPAGGYVEDTPGTVQGRVVDGMSGQPLAGATFDLGGGLTSVTGGDGTFNIGSVPRATHQGTVHATGYQSINFVLAFAPGASGDVGTVSLFPADTAPPPTALTVRGLVADGVSSAPIAGATVTLVETGATLTAGADGRFVFSGLTIKTFSLAVSAAGYASTTYAVQASGFGEVEVRLTLSPPGNGASTTTIAGKVMDAQSGAAVEGARVAIPGTSRSAITGADGRYSLSGIQALEFTVDASAVGYAQQTRAVRVNAHGSYTLNLALEPFALDAFQVVSVISRQAESGANTVALFTARIASLVTVPRSVLVLGEVQDATGTPVATVIPYAEGTNVPTSELSFAPGEMKDLTIPWNTAQFAPATYRLVVRVVEPETIDRAMPKGVVLAENSTTAKVVSTLAIDGAMSIDPPLAQAGLPIPVSFAALVRNGGNARLPAGPYVLTIRNPQKGTTLLTVETAAGEVDVGANVTLPFGSWIPTDAGNLEASVRAKSAGIAGSITGQLYVGDKASGTFAVTPTVVQEGTRTVRGRIAMRGVDTGQGGSTDPLYKLVKQALERGAGYTGPSAVAWHQTNRCLGCHTQTQSLLGLSSSFDKANIDRKPAKYLYNAIATSQHENGALRISNPEYSKTQTALGIWSLEAWPDAQATFRTKYRAAQLIQSWKVRSGDQTYWTPDHPSGWWSSDVSHTALAMKAYANLLRDAGKPWAPSVPSYTLGAAQPLGPGSLPEDMVAGPNGTIYVVKGSGGVITRFDPRTGVVTPVVSGLVQHLQGLAIASDGTLNVTGGGSLIQIKPDGTRTTRAVGHLLRDAIFGPDGWLYLSDEYGNRITRVGSAGQVETYASGGLLNGPSGLEFDGAGNLLVANLNGYNILKIAAADRSVSIYADGLAYRPYRIARAQDGSLYVTTWGLYTSGGLLRVRPDGTAESVIQKDGLFSVVAVGDRLFAANQNNTIQALNVGPLDSSRLAELKAELPRAVRYFLPWYNDSNTDNTIHALRLIGLAEARGFVDDGLLVSRIDSAIAYIASLLRTRQRSDGGWGRIIGQGSDPLITAMVGIALEYTNPSPDDPKIRAAIQYLLNTQRADGSWDSRNNGLGTRLASTSFVLIFLPKALERLGGIDIDLHLELAASVQLTNPTIPPTTVTPVAGGGVAYKWRLLGVTSAERNVEFDLTLAGMAPGEQRSVARKAYLEFDNSFSDQKVQHPLQIPVVSATSAMVLSVQTDKAVYKANEPVLISSNVTNVGPTAASSKVLLAIRAAGSATSIAELPPLQAIDLAPGAQLSLEAAWNTGATLTGDYEVHGQLLDELGRVLSTSVVPFRIDPPQMIATTSVMTNEPVYDAWDTATITGRVRNAAPNTLLAPSRVELTVMTPAGDPLYSQTRPVNQLMPGAIVDLPFTLHLVDAAAGEHLVTLVLKDEFTRAVLSTSTTSFQVQRRAVQSLTGTVTVSAQEVFQGDPNLCTETATNVSASAVAGVTLIHRLVSADSSTSLDTVNQTTDLAGGETNTYVRSISTEGLAKGGYACILTAAVDGSTRTLASAGFRVVDPPVKFTASLALGRRGRLLVLLDGPAGGEADGDDPYGPQGAPKLAAQRAFLETLLTDDGWSFTITQTAEDFTREFHTGGYFAYALFSEQEKLSEQTQQELREAVFRGEGLLVAGDHDSRNQKAHDALGVKYMGHLPDVDGVTPVSGSALPSPFSLLAGEHPPRIERVGASSLGVYQGGSALDAVTLNSYGRAWGGFSGADLLAIATRDGQSSPAADDLRKLLRLVHAPAIAPRPGAVVPLVLTVANQGIAVPITVTGAATFSFQLAENEVKTVTFFVQMPWTPGPVTVEVAVTGTHGIQSFTVRPTLTLTLPPLQALPELKAALDALVEQVSGDGNAPRQASAAVGRAIEHPSQAVKFVLQACDALQGLDDPRVVTPRAGLGLWLRWARSPVSQ